MYASFVQRWRGCCIAWPPSAQRSRTLYTVRCGAAARACVLAQAANEAKDNVKYLSTLERFVDPLYTGTAASIAEGLPALLNSVKMVHTIARYYNTSARMTGLFVKITNQMIATCKVGTTLASTATKNKSVKLTLNGALSMEARTTVACMLTARCTRNLELRMRLLHMTVPQPQENALRMQSHCSSYCTISRSPLRNL